MYLFEVGGKKKKAVHAWSFGLHGFLRSKKIQLVTLSAYVILRVKNNNKKNKNVSPGCVHS